MSDLPPCFGVIPARYQSRRFPAKPLAEILGKPMFCHVYERAIKCPELQKVVLATDDERIAEAAERWNVPVLMTRSDHVSGTDRILEAAELLGLPDDALVVNIQGDEPALEPAMLSQLLAPFTSPSVKVTTLARKINASEASREDQVKVVFNCNQQALYFSRSALPYSRDDVGVQFYGHIGLYAFRMEVLKAFVSMGPSRLEKTEKLEQLRLLENGISIHVVVTEYSTFGVDRPEDIEKVSRIMAQK